MTMLEIWANAISY